MLRSEQPLNAPDSIFSTFARLTDASVLISLKPSTDLTFGESVSDVIFSLFEPSNFSTGIVLFTKLGTTTSLAAPT